VATVNAGSGRPAQAEHAPENNAHLVGWALGITLLGFLVPLLLYWVVLGSVPSLSVPEARRMLKDPGTVLIEVEPVPAYLPDSIHGRTWPLAEILRLPSRAQIPTELQDKRILLLCPGGIHAAQAVRHLRGLGFEQARFIRGGAQEWLPTLADPSAGMGREGQAAQTADSPHFRTSPWFEQGLAVFTFFGVKAVYTLLSALIIVLLWRAVASDLAAIRRAMLAFFMGEGCCFFNVTLFGDHSLLLEHLHSAGMVLSLALLAYGVLEGLDARLIHVRGSARCTAQGLCQVCSKQAPVPCGLRRLFLWLVPGIAFTAALPLCSALRENAYTTRILGVLHGYRHPILHQIYELRFLPALTILLLTACWLTLLLEPRSLERSKLLFAAALGAMGFSFMRLMLVATFIDNQVWFGAWEELTELLLVGAIGVVLWLFHRGLRVAVTETSDAKRGLL